MTSDNENPTHKLIRQYLGQEPAGSIEGLELQLDGLAALMNAAGGVDIDPNSCDERREKPCAFPWRDIKKLENKGFPRLGFEGNN